MVEDAPRQMPEPGGDSGLELITVGRVGVDLYPEQLSCTLAEVRSFRKSLGGTATNVAVSASRLGHQSAVITKVGDDGFGEYVRSAIKAFGVDARWVSTHPTLRTPLAFCEAYPPDHFPLLFYREPTAPDMTITRGDFDAEAPSTVPILWITGTGFSAEPSRETHMQILSERRRNASSSQLATVLDLDYRSMFWDSPLAARRALEAVVSFVDVAIGNLDEIEVLIGDRDPQRAVETLANLGVGTVVVKQGPAGVLAKRGSEEVELEASPVEVVCGLGAGDAFGGAFCHGLLQGWDLYEIVSFANAAGAIVASRLTCADAMPTEGEVLEMAGAR